MTSTMTSGRPRRRQLSEEIDRLEGLVDALAVGLNEAVAMVVEQAVGRAVNRAVAEALASPELRQKLSATSEAGSAAARQAPGVWGRLAARAKSAWSWVAGMARCGWARARAAVGRWCGAARARAAGAWAGAAGRVRGLWVWAVLVARFARRLRGPLLIAAGVGLAVGTASYLAGPVVASALNGLAGFAGTLAASALAAARRALAPGWQRA